MIKYASVNGISKIIFKSKDSALNHVRENPDHIYKEYNEWKYFNPEKKNSTTSYESIQGNNITEAIEASFKKIAENASIGFYTLDNVMLIDNKDGSATLNIVFWPTSSIEVGFAPSMLSEENKETVKMQILDVIDGDIPNGKIQFEIKRN